MTKVLTFAELVPERDQFELANGDIIDFLSMAELDAIDAARAMQIQKRIEGIDTDELTEENAGALNDALADLIRLILPAIPVDVLADLKTGQRLLIVRFWSDNNQALDLEKKDNGQA